MSLSTDALLERIRLKTQLQKWRAFTIILGAAFVLLWYGGSPDIVGRNYIARVVVQGLIQEDFNRDEVLRSLAEDDNVEAVIVYINTPGGTVVGGESIYNNLKHISESKPVVSVMGTLATSAGYMVALGTDHVIASKGTVTGSIGVILHAAEVVDLAEKIGVKFNILKSGKLKASPSPFEKMSPAAEQAAQSVIDNFYNVFLDMVVENRKLDKAQVAKIADGRVFTGLQAVDLNLVDAIGDEQSALEWLEKEKGITTDNVKEVDLYKKEGGLEGILNSLDAKKALFPKILSLQGLLSVWVDGII